MSGETGHLAPSTALSDAAVIRRDQTVGSNSKTNAKRLLEFRSINENLAFQIRSSWAQFRGIVRFRRVEKSITYVFSIRLNIPTPPASTISGYRALSTANGLRNPSICVTGKPHKDSFAIGKAVTLEAKTLQFERPASRS